VTKPGDLVARPIATLPIIFNAMDYDDDDASAV